MAPEAKVFRAIGALVTNVQTPRKVTVGALVDINGKDDVATIKQLTVDLDKSPSVINTGDWSAIQCDDRGVDAQNNPIVFSYEPWLQALPITSVGSPDFPIHMVAVGAVYVEVGWLGTVPNWPPADTYYVPQLTSTAYKPGTGDVRAGRRYHGFLGMISAVTGSVITLKIGSATAKVDWKLPSQCDPDPPQGALDGLPSKLPDGTPILPVPSTVTTASVGKALQIFIALPWAVGQGLKGPKMPIALDDGDGVLRPESGSDKRRAAEL